MNGQRKRMTRGLAFQSCPCLLGVSRLCKLARRSICLAASRGRRLRRRPDSCPSSVNCSPHMRAALILSPALHPQPSLKGKGNWERGQETAPLLSTVRSPASRTVSRTLGGA